MATRVVGQGDEADRAMIIISDGEDQNGQAEAAAREAKEAGVHIFAVGIGTDEGAPIPLAAGGFKKDPDGAMVLSRIEEKTLQRVARSGGPGALGGGIGDMSALYRTKSSASSSARAAQSARRCGLSASSGPRAWMVPGPDGLRCAGADGRERTAGWAPHEQSCGDGGR